VLINIKKDGDTILNYYSTIFETRFQPISCDSGEVEVDIQTSVSLPVLIRSQKWLLTSFVLHRIAVAAVPVISGLRISPIRNKTAIYPGDFHQLRTYKG
jgi:hypothetical protein